MRIFRCTNTNGRFSLIVAESEDNAIKMSVEFQIVRSPRTVKIEDVTDEYSKHHSLYGFVMPEKEGVLLQEVYMGKRSWNVYTLG